MKIFHISLNTHICTNLLLECRCMRQLQQIRVDFFFSMGATSLRLVAIKKLMTIIAPINVHFHHMFCYPNIHNLSNYFYDFMNQLYDLVGNDCFFYVELLILGHNSDG